MWFSVVCTLIANDTRHRSGQNLLWTYSAGPRESTTFDHCSLRAGSLVWQPRTGEAGEKNVARTHSCSQLSVAAPLPLPVIPLQTSEPCSQAMTTVMTRTVVDKSTDHAKPHSIC